MKGISEAYPDKLRSMLDRGIITRAEYDAGLTAYAQAEAEHAKAMDDRKRHID